MAALLAILLIGLSGLVTLVVLATLAFSPRRDASWQRLKRIVITAIPTLLGIVVLVVGFANDPLWPDQDETPERRAARLAAKAVADRLYWTSTTLSACGLIGITSSLLFARRLGGGSDTESTLASSSNSRN